MAESKDPDEGWTPRDGSGDDGSPWSAESSGAGDGIGDGSDYYTGEPADPGPASGGTDDYAPYADAGGYDAPPPAAESPYGQPSADPYGQPSADPYGQPSATPYGQPSADPYGHPSATPPPADPPPADSFPAYHAPGGANPYGQPSPYGGQPSPYGQHPVPYGQGQGYGGYQQSPYLMNTAVNHPRAVPALVCGIVGMFCCPVVSVVAIVLGISARRDTTAEPTRWTGGAMALAGIILGGISAAYGSIYWLLVLIGVITS